MGAFRAIVACCAVAACAEAPATAPGPDRAAQETACDRAVAAHVGLAPDAVATALREARANGIAVFEARDGGRMHLCEVDAAGRVLRLDHPLE